MCLKEKYENYFLYSLNSKARLSKQKKKKKAGSAALLGEVLSNRQLNKTVPCRETAVRESCLMMVATVLCYHRKL